MDVHSPHYARGGCIAAHTPKLPQSGLGQGHVISLDSDWVVPGAKSCLSELDSGHAVL